MQVIEGAQYRLRVKLTNEAGEPLPPENFRVYGGAFCPGKPGMPFDAQIKEDEWVLTVPGLTTGCVPWAWQVFAAEYATGVEWLIAGGEITVYERHATGGEVMSPEVLDITAALDKNTMQVIVQLGDSTVVCREAMEYARASAREARASAMQAAESASDAANSAELAGKRAAEAAGSATDAATGSKAAADSATDAANRASAAAASAELAGKRATEAAGSATDAATSSKAAADSASDAATSSKAAADSASDAIQAAERAEAGATDAAASASDARAAYELRYCTGMPEVMASSCAYDLGVVAGEVDLSGLHFEEREDIVQTAELWMDCGAGVSVSWPEGCIWVGDEPEMAEGTAYRFVVRQEKLGRFLISVAYEYVAE